MLNNMSHQREKLKQILVLEKWIIFVTIRPYGSEGFRNDLQVELQILAMLTGEAALESCKLNFMEDSS